MISLARFIYFSALVVTFSDGIDFDTTCNDGTYYLELDIPLPFFSPDFGTAGDKYVTGITCVYLFLAPPGASIILECPILEFLPIDANNPPGCPGSHVVMGGGVPLCETDNGFFKIVNGAAASVVLARVPASPFVELGCFCCTATAVMDTTNSVASGDTTCTTLTCGGE